MNVMGMHVKGVIRLRVNAKRGIKEVVILMSPRV